MKQTIRQVLIKYWGYSQFRPLQEDIIISVLNDNDTLALLPTGGGKSICFQVPAMAKDGICIVISPLIALIKDQVENLNKRGIKAFGIYSGMHKNEIDVALDNCVYGDVKFLYLSPERLNTELLKVRIRKMNVNMIAVDEAHCISQWGYDFRPPYLKIADIREIIPKAPILALTATATPEVVNDIQEKLHFKTKNVLQKSFERKNLAYVVIKEEEKLNRLLKIANNVKGTGIVYVRNRKKTKEVSDFLNQNNIRADYYHAGMDAKARDYKQNFWMQSKIRVIVATNAFGMGIDKPDVRFVVHLDIPDSIEAYFQEAGRGGRDGNKAFAVMLYNENDLEQAERNFAIAYPEISEIKTVYQALGNYFQLAIGSGPDASFDFDINDFCNKYAQNPAIVFSSIKFLEREGYLLTTDALYEPSKLKITVSREDLYKFQIKNPQLDGFTKTLLRTYGGVFSDFVKINESELGRSLGISALMVKEYMMRLHKLQILTYIPQKEKPQLIYCTERVDSKDLQISPENYHTLKQRAKDRLDAIITYVTKDNRCRSQTLLDYFGEINKARCGSCDVCLERNKLNLSKLKFDMILEIIKPLLQKNPCTIDELILSTPNFQEEEIMSAIQWLTDNDKICYDESGLFLKWCK